MASNELHISSFRSEYSVRFVDGLTNLQQIIELYSSDSILVIDELCLQLYPQFAIGFQDRIISIQASETEKEFSRLTHIIERLLQLNIKKNTRLVVIGGGVVQDISCFVSSILFRGIKWVFIPTTMLSQVDSCIGSKSSINFTAVKNLVGTFYPPNEILICKDVLATLPLKDLYSGIGEILKVCIIDGHDGISLFRERVGELETPLEFSELTKYCLAVKKRYIEIDEFDQGPRNIFNLGHTFGHAVEVATNYKIPHGLAVCIGIFMAFDYAYRLDRISYELRDNVCTLARAIWRSADLDNIVFCWESFQSAIRRDKKNIGSSIVLVIPEDDNCNLIKFEVHQQEAFFNVCREMVHELFNCK